MKLASRSCDPCGPAGPQSLGMVGHDADGGARVVQPAEKTLLPARCGGGERCRCQRLGDRERGPEPEKLANH